MTVETFLLSFIPLFVAIDIIGTVPIFLGYTHEISVAQRKKLILEALLAAFIVANIFLIGGKAVLNFMGITIDDSEKRRDPGTDIGVVPLGIPLIMGPAALTTILILIDNFGYLPTIFSMVLNFVIVGLVLLNAQWLIKAIGQGGSRAFAKIASLLLASIAVMMIRVGVINIYSSLK